MLSLMEEFYQQTDGKIESLANGRLPMSFYFSIGLLIKFFHQTEHNSGFAFLLPISFEWVTKAIKLVHLQVIQNIQPDSLITQAAWQISFSNMSSSFYFHSVRVVRYWSAWSCLELPGAGQVLHQNLHLHLDSSNAVLSEKLDRDFISSMHGYLFVASPKSVKIFSLNFIWLYNKDMTSIKVQIKLY